MREGLADRFAREEIELLVVWIDILPTDRAPAARRAARIFEGAGAAQFHDPGRATGDALGGILGTAGPAWDVYLLYEPGVAWGDAAPRPAEWFHQLGGGVGPPERFHTGHDLAARLFDGAIERGARPKIDEAPTEEEYRLAERRAADRLQATDEDPGDEPVERCDRCRRGGIGQCTTGQWERVTATRAPGGSDEVEGEGLIHIGQDVADAEPGARTVRVRVLDLGCPDCMPRVVAGMVMVDGVESASLEYTGAIAEATLVEGAEVEPATIVEAIARMGHEAEPVVD